MKEHRLYYLVFIAANISWCLSSSCLNTFGSFSVLPELDGFLVVTPPSLDIGGKHGFYAATREKPNLGGQTQDFVWQNLVYNSQGDAAANAIRLFSAHVDTAVSRNAILLDYLQSKKKSPLEGFDYGDDPDLPFPEVFQLWLQHDPYHYEAPQGGPSIEKAHTKMLLTIDLKNKNGYVIMHSVTKIPYNLYPNPNNFQSFSKIFKDEDEKNRFVPSQHIFCFSLRNEGDVSRMLKGIKSIYPAVVAQNFHLDFLVDPDNAILLEWHKQLDHIVNNRDVERIANEGRDCYMKYKNFMDKDFALSYCLRISNFDSGIALLRHCKWYKNDQITNKLAAPLPRLLPKKSSEETIVLATQALGPMPWLVAAKAMDDDLMLHHYRCKKHIVSAHSELRLRPPLPHPQHVEHQVFTVLQRTITIIDSTGSYAKTWKYDYTHDKIAVGMKSSKVCVGDSNHDYNQIHHAGFTACFESETLANFIRSWPKSYEDAKTGTKVGERGILNMQKTVQVSKKLAQDNGWRMQAAALVAELPFKMKKSTTVQPARHVKEQNIMKMSTTVQPARHVKEQNIMKMSTVRYAAHPRVQQSPYMPIEHLFDEFPFEDIVDPFV